LIQCKDCNYKEENQCWSYCKTSREHSSEKIILACKKYHPAWMMHLPLSSNYTSPAFNKMSGATLSARKENSISASGGKCMALVPCQTLLFLESSGRIRNVR
jgi:hypothetical protein